MLGIAKFLHENVLKIRLTDPVGLNLNLKVKGRARTWLHCQIKTEVIFSTSYTQNRYSNTITNTMETYLACTSNAQRKT